MKFFVPLMVLPLFVLTANAANNARPAMSNKIMSAQRYTASVNQLNSMAGANGNSSVEVEETEEEQIDRREAERNACINNNIGIGNTFVWASKYSDISNYASMVEDMENPQNNVCFVRVELKSDDASRVDVSDIKAKYFMWGEAITCGSWVDEQEMEQRILDAKKGARVGGIVASTVGGVGLGVGMMELFGNKAISAMGGTKVEGQKALSDEENAKYQLSVYRTENPVEYDRIKESLKIIGERCKTTGGTDSVCTQYRDLIDYVNQEG